MPVTFQSSALQSLYNSGAASATVLNTFRTGGDTELDAAIEALDQRIAAFEFALIGNLPSGQTSSAYPYDREGLRREFLDELVALLMRRSVEGLTINNTYTDPASIAGGNPAAPFGGLHLSVNKLAPPTSPALGNFGNLPVSATDAQINSDQRLNYLNATGQNIFRTYSALIDAVFSEGDRLGSNPATPTQSIGAIQPLSVDGVTYDRIAQVSGLISITTGTPPRSTQVPSYETYLLSSDAPESRVTKDNRGNADLIVPPSNAAQRLYLYSTEATLLTASPLVTVYTAPVDGVDLLIETSATGITVRTDVSEPRLATTEIPPLRLNLPGRGHEFPEVSLTANQRVTASNGVTYLIGLGTDGKVYATSLAPGNRSPVGTTASLSALEYLLFYNEARIKILRAKLAYNEAVVREIQDDLRAANAALAELETQAGAVIATLPDGNLSGQFSSETFEMSLFNAAHSTAGKPLFTDIGMESAHLSSQWEQNRANLKNYIDRRSAEAQQATLDYQNTLNRFNNAFEVMAKLQEKLDTLLKAQLRNLS